MDEGASAVFGGCADTLIEKTFVRFKKNFICSQCCGTETNFYGSGSDLAPYLDHHKKHSFPKIFVKILPFKFNIVNFSLRKKLISFIKFIIKCE